MTDARKPIYDAMIKMGLIERLRVMGRLGDGLADEAADEIGQLRTSLKEMIDCYWGAGDGEPPPSFVQRAIDLTKDHAP